MNKRQKEALDRHITGNYGEDQFTQTPHMKTCQRCKYVWEYGGKLMKPTCPSCGARVTTGTGAKK